MSLSAVGIPWGDAVKEVCFQVGLSCIASNGGDPVSIDVRGADVVAVLRDLGLQRALRAEIEGKSVRFVPAGRDSSAVLLPGWVDAEEAASVAAAAAGDGAVLKVVGGQFVAVGDEPSLSRLRAFTRTLEESRPRQWVCSVWVIETSEDYALSLGVRVSAAGGIDIAGAVGGGVASIMGTALIRAVLDAEANAGNSVLLNRGTLVATEGTSAKLDAGSRVPIPKRTVSPQGTVSTSGYDFVEAGFSLSVDASRAPGNAVRMVLKPEISSITGYREDAPIVSRRRLESVVILHHGEYVVLAGLDDEADSSQSRGLLGLSVDRRSTGRRVFVVVRVEDGG